MFIPKILDFISPRFCVTCNTKLSCDEKFICTKCFSQITPLSEKEIKNEFGRKFEKSKIVSDYNSLFLFEEKKSIQDLIHNLKYNQKFKIGLFLGQLLCKTKTDIIKNWSADFIVPIPLHHLKKVERGYNQAEYIAKGIGKECNIKVATNFAVRKKNTLTQTKLSNDERIKNMMGAFKVKNSQKFRGKNIIIVDDVITTGTTVLELAKILKAKGANKIFCLSVATPPFLHSIGSSNS